MIFTVVYNNYAYDPALTTGWGFGCLIEAHGKTILFDTGGNPKILFANMDELKIEPDSIDIVVISHNHGDHTGGLEGFLSANSNIILYLPPSFGNGQIKKYSNTGTKIVIVEKPVEICPGIFSTGPLYENVTEQALIVSTARGPVIVTGCSHPGIIKIVEKAKTIINEDPYLVFGGFHLLRTSHSGIKSVIEQFKVLGVKKAGPTHCSGDETLKLFKTAFADDYEDMGVGRILTISKAP